MGKKEAFHKLISVACFAAVNTEGKEDGSGLSSHKTKQHKVIHMQYVMLKHD